MLDQNERAALVLLLRRGSERAERYSELVQQTGSALAILDQELGMLGRAEIGEVVDEIGRWEARGIRLETVLDPSYPENLRGVHDQPPILFIAGALAGRDARGVAVIGSRRATRGGIAAARAVAHELVDSGFTVFSGLAAGIDAAVHTAVLSGGGRTVAVIGTGLDHAYPPQNAELQRSIAERCAVVSRFLPESGPTQRSFPLRNAVMSGLSLATVVVEASSTSGARTQARLALAHGRPVVLLNSLLEQAWAREFAERPGTYVIRSPTELIAILERLTATAQLTA